MGFFLVALMERAFNQFLRKVIKVAPYMWTFQMTDRINFLIGKIFFFFFDKLIGKIYG